MVRFVRPGGMCLLFALGLPAQGPTYTRVAESVFEMKGQIFSRATLELDLPALRRCIAQPAVPSEDPLHRALRGLREGRVRFRIRQSWEVDVSGAQRRAFNAQVAGEIWAPLPPFLRPALDRFLAWSDRSVNFGEAWEHESLGGGRLRSRYGAEPWRTWSDPGMTAVVAGLYLEGPDTTPGTRVAFRKGLVALLGRAQPVHP